MLCFIKHFLLSRVLFLNQFNIVLLQAKITFI